MDIIHKIRTLVCIYTDLETAAVVGYLRDDHGKLAWGTFTHYVSTCRGDGGQNFLLISVLKLCSCKGGGGGGSGIKKALKCPYVIYEWYLGRVGTTRTSCATTRVTFPLFALTKTL